MALFFVGYADLMQLGKNKKLSRVAHAAMHISTSVSESK